MSYPVYNVIITSAKKGMPEMEINPPPEITPQVVTPGEEPPFDVYTPEITPPLPLGRRRERRPVSA